MTIQSVKDLTSFKWGTIVDTGPLQLRLDGDESPLAATPDSLVDPSFLKVGDRVRTEMTLRKVVIHGKSNGVAALVAPSLPTPWTWASGGSVNVDGAAATWTDIDAAAAKVYTLADPLWVMVEGSANINGAASTYGMIGVQATGALALEPEVGIDGSSSRFGYTAYSEIAASTGGKTLTFHKMLLLPAGATTLKFRKRRNVTTGTPTLGYATILITPIAWDGTPGVIADDTGWTDLTPYLVGGFTATAGNIEGRRSGEDLEIRGIMTAPTTAAGASAVDFLDNIPTWLRPTKRIGFGTGVNNGYATAAYARTDGSVAMSVRDGLSGSTQFTIKYFRG